MITFVNIKKFFIGNIVRIKNIIYFVIYVLLIPANYIDFKRIKKFTDPVVMICNLDVIL